MKELFIKDVYKLNPNSNITLYGWVKRMHGLKRMIFLDLTDSTGTIQIILNRNNKNLIKSISKIKVESALKVFGVVKSKKDGLEVLAKNLEIISNPSKNFTPSPRSDFEIFDSKFSNLVDRKRHLYLRNPKMIHVLKMRYYLLRNIRKWYESNDFIEITAPILTSNTLYDDKTAIKVKINKRNVFLTQCVGYYLEASVHALEKVYNIGPSFRAQESHTKRHLMEYWHVKAEVAFADLEFIINFTEKFIQFLFKSSMKYNKDNTEILGHGINKSGAVIPFPRISYEDAILYLKTKNVKIAFGDHIGPGEEKILSHNFNNRPFWIVHNPRKLEPFPYSIEERDERVVKTADLIADSGYGEILGVAEKIYSGKMLRERMKEKGKLKDKKYSWIIEVNDLGTVPHVAMGMGLERLTRWIFNIEHVKNTIPFPRTFRKAVYP